MQLAPQFLPPPTPQTGEIALFLDVDGTLAPIAETPDQVRIPGETLILLETLYRLLDGALGLISGRSLHSIDQLCNPLVLPAAGQHGLEVRTEAGTKPVRTFDPMPILALESEIEQLQLDFPELYTEYKGLSIAVHYRKAPHLEKVVRYCVEDIIRPFKDYVCLQWGKMVCEIRLCGADKGSAIRSLMVDPTFAGRLPVFVGDDLTDEAGFDAVNKLGGISIKIGEESTLAKYRLADIRQLHLWLVKLAEQEGEQQGGKVCYG